MSTALIHRNAVRYIFEEVVYTLLFSTANATSFSPSTFKKMPLPSRRETHFWYVLPDEVQNTSVLRQCLEILSPSEREHVSSIKAIKLQKAALLSRALLRTTIARYTDCKASPSSLKFSKNIFGKPQVEWHSDGNWAPPLLHFNISHTSSLVACAVTTDVPVGIDVEEKRRQLKSSILSFAKRYFSPSEVEYLNGFSETETQRQEFLKLWTLKEAYVKALGRGFSGAPFKDFTIQLNVKDVQDFTESNADATEIIVQPCRDAEILTTDWQFTLFELATSHYAATCVKKKDISKGAINTTHTVKRGLLPDCFPHDNSTARGGENSLKLKVWKMIPFVSDEYVSGTKDVIPIIGLS